MTFPPGPQKRSPAWPGPTEPDAIDLLDELRATFPRLRREHRPPSIFDRLADRIDHLGVSIAMAAYDVADLLREVGR